MDWITTIKHLKNDKWSFHIHYNCSREIAEKKTLIIWKDYITLFTTINTEPLYNRDKIQTNGK